MERYKLQATIYLSFPGVTSVPGSDELPEAIADRILAAEVTLNSLGQLESYDKHGVFYPRFHFGKSEIEKFRVS